MTDHARRLAALVAGAMLMALMAIGASQAAAAPAAKQAGFFTFIQWVWVGGRWVSARAIQCFPNCTWGSFVP